MLSATGRTRHGEPVRAPDIRTRYFEFTGAKLPRKLSGHRLKICVSDVAPSVESVVKSSFQKEIHAVEIDDGLADVQSIHPQDPTDSGVTLPQRELRQRNRAEFCRCYFEITDSKIVNLANTNFSPHTVGKTRRSPRWLQCDSKRANKSFVKSGNKGPCVDEQASGLAMN